MQQHDININTGSESAKSVTFKSYRLARQFAIKAGLPDDINFSNKEVLWQISPNDSALSARIQIIGSKVLAVLTMNYMGRVVQMIRIMFDGVKEVSEGLLYRDDAEKAFHCFRSHLQNMMYGPVLLPAVSDIPNSEAAYL